MDVEFDNKQIVEDLEIPLLRERGTSEYLKPYPFAKNEPVYGEGGLSQAITTKSIQADRIVDQKTGKVVYEFFKRP